MGCTSAVEHVQYMLFLGVSTTQLCQQPVYIQLQYIGEEGQSVSYYTAQSVLNLVAQHSREYLALTVDMKRES